MKSVERDALVFHRKDEGLPGPPSPLAKRTARSENSVYTILNGFALDTRELARWETEKTKRISTVNRKWTEMSVVQLREILDSDLPVTGSAADPKSVMQTLLSEKSSAIVQTCQSKLEVIGRKKRLAAHELITNVKIDKLRVQLGKVDYITVGDLSEMIPLLM
jgi:hypothetical protein